MLVTFLIAVTNVHDKEVKSGKLRFSSQFEGSVSHAGKAWQHKALDHSGASVRKQTETNDRT